MNQQELDRLASDFALNFHNQHSSIKVELADGILVNDNVAEAFKEGFRKGVTTKNETHRLIDKAIEWLKECTTFNHPDYRHSVPYFDDEDLEDFKEYMLREE